jgi:hypothetical protein
MVNVPEVTSAVGEPLAVGEAGELGVVVFDEHAAAINPSARTTTDRRRRLDLTAFSFPQGRRASRGTTGPIDAWLAPHSDDFLGAVAVR